MMNDQSIFITTKLYPGKTIPAKEELYFENDFLKYPFPEKYFDSNKFPESHNIFGDSSYPVIEKYIGHGTYGRIYQCKLYFRYSLIQKSVALKLQLFKEAENKIFNFKDLDIPHNSFEEEIKLQKIASENNLAPKVFSTVECNIASCWSDNKVRKHSFATMVQLDRTLYFYLYHSKKDNIQMVRQLIFLVDSLHSIDIFHGDLHTQNIMLDSNENPFFIDFGKSKNMSDMNLDQRLWCKLHDFAILSNNCPRNSLIQQELKKECQRLVPNVNDRNNQFYEIFQLLL